jgi:hypothetical protein
MTDDQAGRQEASDDRGITRRKLVGTGIAAVGATVVWGSPIPFSRKGIGQQIDSARAEGQGASGATGHKGDSDPLVDHPTPNVGYCAVAGNTWPDGTPIPPGQFIPMPLGQPDTDPNYKGATLAIYVQGFGVMCPPAPPGYVQAGLYNGPDVPPNLYQYWVKPG